MLIHFSLMAALAITQSGVTEPEEIMTLIQSLTNGQKEPDSYTRAVERLEALGRRAVPPLMEALASKNEELQAEAASILGRIRDPAAIPSLARLVKRDGKARVEALRALGHIGGPEAAFAIMSALPLQDSGAQAELVHALGAIGDRRAIESLGKLLEKEGRDDVQTRVRVMAAEALGHFRDPRTRDILNKAIITDPAWSVYRAATLALDEVDEHHTPLSLQADVILAVSKEEEPPEGAPAFVRRWEEERRKQIQAAKEAGDGDGPSVFGPTIGMFASKVDIERARARLLDHVRISLRSPGKDVVELSMEYLNGNRKTLSAVMSRAQELIIRVGRPAVPSLLNGLKRGDTTMKWRCAECLAHIGDASAIQPLKDYATGQSSYEQGRIQKLIDKLESKQNGKNNSRN